MNEIMYKDLLTDLKCSACSNYMEPPIFQCGRGHNISLSCVAKHVILKQCPTCGEKITEIRNLVLEKVASNLIVPCANKEQGCTVNLALADTKEHEKNCYFRGIRCAMRGCSWIGQIDDLQRHWDSKNMADKTWVNRHLNNCNIRAKNNFVNLIKAHDKLFWLETIVKDDISWICTPIGRDIDPSLYFFEVEISKKNLIKRKLTLSEYCSAFEGGPQQGGRPLVSNVSSLPIICLNRYLTNNQILTYRINIKCVKNQTGQGETSSKRKIPEMGTM